jgi:threonine dehydrogenase-like Zn-dependent dehydrogenase
MNPMQRAVDLLERGVFDLSKLVTHRHPIADVRSAMDLGVRRPAGYIKGVLQWDAD